MGLREGELVSGQVLVLRLLDLVVHVELLDFPGSDLRSHVEEVGAELLVILQSPLGGLLVSDHLP